jgi:hypothetical protein
MLLRRLLGTWIVTTAALAADTSQVTFYRDVLPVLQKRCQDCHRPGEIGPMPLVTYREARPWAKAIKEAVRLRKMPPWFADPSVGRFRNDPRLTTREIDLLSRWADTGAAEGAAKDGPRPREWVEGWNIKPEIVFELPKPYDVPAAGTVEYTYFIMPSGLTKDTWVQAGEFRPGNRSVLHHATVFFRAPGSSWLRNYPQGEYFVPSEQVARATARSPIMTTNAGASPYEERFLGYVPGRQAMVLPPGQARLIPAGSDIVIQFHYTTAGKVASDRSRFGLVVAKEPPRRRFYSTAVATDSFAIPPRAPNHVVQASMTLHADSELTGFYPNMHLRGKSMEYRAIYPDGGSELLLRVPRYDFNWQLVYELDQPKRLPRGTRIEVTGTFDNSPNNPHNPDPAAEVRWGDQSWEEMLAGFMQLTIDPALDILELLGRGPRAAR